MKMAIPLEVLDEHCRTCPNFKAEIRTASVVDDDKNIIGYVVQAECSNLGLCIEGTNANYQ